MACTSSEYPQSSVSITWEKVRNLPQDATDDLESRVAANSWISCSKRDKLTYTFPAEPGNACDASLLARPSDVGSTSGFKHYASPQRCSAPLFNGTRTTVRQSLVPSDFNRSHQPHVKRIRPRPRTFSVQSREHFELRCCRIHVLLVVMEFCLGVIVTALGFYMETITPTLRMWECPQWAGIPLVVAGILGIYFCATDFAAYSASVKGFLVKAMCFLLSTASVFVCLMAAVFTGIHGNRIASYHRCDMNVSRCECAETSQHLSRLRFYDGLTNCDTVFTSVKDYLILQCALNAIASGVCLWFVTLLWSSKYQSVHSNIRFLSNSEN